MDFSQILAELVALLREAWPDFPGMDAKPRRIYTSVQALRLSFVESLRDNTIGEECVVIQIGKLVHDPGWGLASETGRLPIAFFYVGPDGTKQSAIHARLVALRDVIEDYGRLFDNFQAPPERATIDTSEESPINASIVGDSGVRIASGHVEWTPGLIVPF